ncbi:MAG: ABC transporter substrate-binding protein [Deltaproteobacteria bacterium]|nr:ABC transporter substrate-binding protein [Deltaproteobacteria bacterium]
MRQINLFTAVFVALAWLCPVLAGPAEGPQKIRIGFPSLAFSYMPFYVAQEKGLLKKFGLEAEYIQMRTGIQPQALINGNINFFPSVSTGISAAVSGLPLVTVLNFYNGTPWVLVTNKSINKPQDLIGKNLAVSGIRTSPHWFLQAALKKWEIPEKDVSLISTGGTSSSFAVLTTNQVTGAVLTPPFDDKAVSLGFKKFMFIGDLAPIPYVGLMTSQAEVRSNRDRVQKTIAALWEAVAWLRANRAESAKMIANKFKVTPAEAERTHETMVGMFTKDGRLDPQVARGYLDLLRQERPVPADFDAQKLLDFSLLPAG